MRKSAIPRPLEPDTVSTVEGRNSHLLTVPSLPPERFLVLSLVFGLWLLGLDLRLFGSAFNESAFPAPAHFEIEPAKRATEGVT